jgi:hypothetical protein
MYFIHLLFFVLTVDFKGQNYNKVGIFLFLEGKKTGIFSQDACSLNFQLTNYLQLKLLKCNAKIRFFFDWANFWIQDF